MRGGFKPVPARQTIFELIAATTTDAGLKVRCGVNTNANPKGVKVDDAEAPTSNAMTSTATGTTRSSHTAKIAAIVH